MTPVTWSHLLGCQNISLNLSFLHYHSLLMKIVILINFLIIYFYVHYTSRFLSFAWSAELNLHFQFDVYLLSLHCLYFHHLFPYHYEFFSFMAIPTIFFSIYTTLILKVFTSCNMVIKSLYSEFDKISDWFLLKISKKLQQ